MTSLVNSIDLNGALHQSMTFVAAAAGEDVPMFGLTWPKFLAQVCIFFVIYLILKKKAFGPIVDMLETRRRRIEENEAIGKKVREDLAAAEEKSKEIVAQADADAGRLITEARESAADLAEKKRQEAIVEASQILTKAREASTLERDRVMTELKTEFGRLVADTTSRVTGKVLTPEDQERLNRDAVSSVTN